MSDSINDVALKLARDFHKKQEFLTEEQLRQCIYEAILSGDFVKHCMPVSAVMNSDAEATSFTGNYSYNVSYSQAMTYIPFRKADELEQQLKQTQDRLKDAERIVKAHDEYSLPYDYEINILYREYFKKYGVGE